jgi:predicted N-acetyltransferase YhbS
MSVSLGIREATTLEDTRAAHELLDAAARKMLHDYGLQHWLYPFKNVDLLARLASSTSSFVLLAFDGATAVATLTVSRVPLSAHYGDDDAQWMERGAPAAYLGNLAVTPTAAGRGFGSALVRAACESARLRFCARFLRLDAITEHPFLGHFYARAGFVPRGRGVVFTHPNKFAGGATTVPGPPDLGVYLVNDLVDVSSSTFSVTCQSWELALL